MNGAPRGRLCLIGLMVAAVLAGCGGSNSNHERTQLVNKLYAQLGTSNLPRPLGTCIVQQARGLPLDQLRAVANSGSNASGPVKRLGLRLVSTCMQQGPGLAAMHQLIVQTFEKEGGSSLPSAFRTCFEQKANATSAAQLMQLLSAYASQGSAAAQAQSIQLGRQLGAECLQQPSVLNVMRTTFVAAIERELQSSHDSAAYKTCLVGKMRALSSRQLSQLVLNPSQTSQFAQRIGSSASKACIASGATP